MLVISTGCPAGIGPEVSLAAAGAARGRVVLVGDPDTLAAAAAVVGVRPERLVAFGARRVRGALEVLAAGPRLSPADRAPGKPSSAAGRAALAYVEAGYDLVKHTAGAALVTGPVSKVSIARSGARGAARFTGHTEWLGERDRAPHTVMCFAGGGLATSLVTTHLPLARVPRALTPEAVRDATLALAELLAGLGRKRPRIAVASLNPHAGEGELFGGEEARAIVPGIALAQGALGRRAQISGPVGAETAYRKAQARAYDGVVAMYHDQATIPMKLVAFGDAVNVTWGLSIVRTSVDHGTGYDIAWRGVADAAGMTAALQLASRLVKLRRAPQAA